MTTIYITLLDEGTDVWRPVRAEQVTGDLYRLAEKPPQHDRWPFGIGDVVRCKDRALTGTHGHSTRVLVAYERASAP